MLSEQVVDTYGAAGNKKKVLTGRDWGTLCKLKLRWSDGDGSWVCAGDTVRWCSRGSYTHTGWKMGDDRGKQPPNRLALTSQEREHDRQWRAISLYIRRPQSCRWCIHAAQNASDCVRVSEWVNECKCGWASACEPLPCSDMCRSVWQWLVSCGWTRAHWWRYCSSCWSLPSQRGAVEESRR